MSGRAPVRLATQDLKFVQLRTSCVIRRIQCNELLGRRQRIVETAFLEESAESCPQLGSRPVEMPST
jgi:hypothetical protein